MSQLASHDWIRTDSNSTKCQFCHKKIKSLAGRRCVWCQEMVSAMRLCIFEHERLNQRGSLLSMFLSLLKRHDECVFLGISTCDCGPFRDHILPPWAIYAVSKVKYYVILYNELLQFAFFEMTFVMCLFNLCSLKEEDNSLLDVTPDGHILQVCRPCTFITFKSETMFCSLRLFQQTTCSFKLSAETTICLA